MESELRTKAIAAPDGALVIGLQGVLNAQSTGILVDQFEKALKHKTRKYILDLKGLTYLSSVGVGALVTFLNQTRAKGRVLTLARIPPDIHRVLTMVGFMKMVPVEGG